MARHASSLPILCLALGLALATARAGDQSQIAPDSAWKRVEQKDGVTLMARSRPGSGVKEFSAQGYIPAPPAQVARVLGDVAAYPQYMPYFVEARIVSADAGETVCYERLAPPFVAPRDYTVRITHATLRNGAGAPIYRDTWQADNDAGPPPRAGVVRVKINEGNWLLEPSGTGTQATYQVYTDSGGALPAFIANRASQTAIPKLFAALRKRVTGGQ